MTVGAGTRAVPARELSGVCRGGAAAPPLSQRTPTRGDECRAERWSARRRISTPSASPPPGSTASDLRAEAPATRADAEEWSRARRSAFDRDCQRLRDAVARGVGDVRGQQQFDLTGLLEGGTRFCRELERGVGRALDERRR